jgi:hypothetical protein
MTKDCTLTKNFLQTAIADKNLHARWLNTLSFLEHIGARKIIKSQDSSTLPLMVLEHASEELRHALFFKKLSLKVYENYCLDYKQEFLIGGKKTEDYFQTLDQKISQSLVNYTNKEKTFFTYLYVTLLIEERALKLYQQYQKLLEENGSTISLRPVLVEEQRHLLQMKQLLMENEIHYTENHQHFSLFEQALYEQLMTYLTQKISPVESSHFSHV